MNKIRKVLTSSGAAQAVVVAILATSVLSPGMAYAEQSFTDIPPDHDAHEAVEFLKSANVISGYEDGTFRPDQKVNRAEALKLIIAPLHKPDQILAAKAGVSAFSDVANDAWYKPYVEIARTSGVIDGPPTKTAFNGAHPVLKVEFLKMVDQAFSADAKISFSEIRLPLSKDVTNPDEWYYPYLRYGITSSMTMIGDDGTFNPAGELTRADSAILLHRSIMYSQGRRTQALLAEAEYEIRTIPDLLKKQDIIEAEYASARALLAARGAHKSKPDETIVQGAVKATEAFRALVRGYRAELTQNYDETIRLAGDAWNLGARTKELAPELSEIADQVQLIAKRMADDARVKKAEQTVP